MKKINVFFANLNLSQKIIFFILIISIFVGTLIFDRLGLTGVCGTACGSTYWDSFFTFKDNGFYWTFNIILIFGMYLFKDRTDTEE